MFAGTSRENRHLTSLPASADSLAACNAVCANHWFAGRSRGGPWPASPAKLRACRAGRHRPVPPVADEAHYHRQPQSERDSRYHPRQYVESARRRLSQDLFPILVYKSLQYRPVGFSCREARIQFRQLFLRDIARTGESSARMAALPGDIAAAAIAHDLVPERLRAVGALPLQHPGTQRHRDAQRQYRRRVARSRFTERTNIARAASTARTRVPRKSVTRKSVMAAILVPVPPSRIDPRRHG